MRAVGVFPLRPKGRASGAFVVLSLLSTASSLCAQEPIRIFKGRDLDGWTVHGTELWYVDAGDLICESGPDAQYGYLRTNETYTDFDLTLEFKQEANGNSGVFFVLRSTAPLSVVGKLRSHHQVCSLVGFMNHTVEDG